MNLRPNRLQFSVLHSTSTLQFCQCEVTYFQGNSVRRSKHSIFESNKIPIYLGIFKIKWKLKVKWFQSIRKEWEQMTLNSNNVPIHFHLDCKMWQCVGDELRKLKWIEPDLNFDTVTNGSICLNWHCPIHLLFLSVRLDDDCMTIVVQMHRPYSFWFAVYS